MLLSEIIKRVNAKSFGETDYDYYDIYPYFQEAIDSLNSSLDVHRRIANAPVQYSDTAEYNFLQDIYINNYIVTFIVVAMDNASLSVTSRTQTYAAQLEQFKAQTITDLYKWMPVKSTGASMAFDLTGYNSKPVLDTPQVKVWYDESIGGELSGRGAVAPVKGIRWDNPYGTVVLHPKYVNYKLKLGSNLIPYVFIPNEYFRQYYKNVVVYASVFGHNSEFPVTASAEPLLDIGNRVGLNKLLEAAWIKLKDDNGSPILSMPSGLAGSYTDENGTKFMLILQHESGLCYYDVDSGAYYLASPVDVTVTPMEFNSTEIIINSIDNELKELEANKLSKTEADELKNNIIASIPTKVSQLENDKNYASDTYVDEGLRGKVDKVEGKQLSTNDYTTSEKEKLAGLENYDDTELRNEIDEKVSKVEGKGLSANDLTNELLQLLQDKYTKAETNTLINNLDVDLQKQIDDIKLILTSNDVDFDTLQELVNALKNNVASINDVFTALSRKADKTEIPTKLSQLENDSAFGNLISQVNTLVVFNENDTVLPTSGELEKIYFNIDLNNYVVDSLLSLLYYNDYMEEDYIIYYCNILSFIKNGKNIALRARRKEIHNLTTNQFICIYQILDTEGNIYYDSSNADYHMEDNYWGNSANWKTPGWNPKFDGVIEINGTVSSKFGNEDVLSNTYLLNLLDLVSTEKPQPDKSLNENALYEKKDSIYTYKNDKWVILDQSKPKDNLFAYKNCYFEKLNDNSTLMGGVWKFKNSKIKGHELWSYDVNFRDVYGNNFIQLCSRGCVSRQGAGYYSHTIAAKTINSDYVELCKSDATYWYKINDEIYWDTPVGIASNEDGSFKDDYYLIFEEENESALEMLQIIADKYKVTKYSTNEDLDKKVDKVEGKDLSTNDFTNEEKTKLSNLENYDDTNLVARIVALEQSGGSGGSSLANQVFAVDEEGNRYEVYGVDKDGNKYLVTYTEVE